MKRFTAALATAAALTLGAPVAYAASTFSFDDVATMETVNGSKVYSSDGKLLGTVMDIDLGGDTADFIIEPANSSAIDGNPVIVTAEEGQVLFTDNRLILQATEVQLQVSLNGANKSANTARILLVD
jgi:sporulation protein YlmC with PRC-barrel domain